MESLEAGMYPKITALSVTIGSCYKHLQSTKPYAFHYSKRHSIGRDSRLLRSQMVMVRDAPRIEPRAAIETLAGIDALEQRAFFQASTSLCWHLSLNQPAHIPTPYRCSLFLPGLGRSSAPVVGLETFRIPG